VRLRRTTYDEDRRISLKVPPQAAGFLAFLLTAPPKFRTKKPAGHVPAGFFFD
jgi:hypothetical protein